jgi:hypothetical protein
VFFVWPRRSDRDATPSVVSLRPSLHRFTQLRSQTSPDVLIWALATTWLAHVQSFGRFDEISDLVEKTPGLTLPDLWRSAE